MLDGLHQVRGGDSALPFVLQFYSEPSQDFWQGDAYMPMLCALGQHGALPCLQDFLLPHEHLFNDMYVVCLPDRVGPTYKHLQEALDKHVTFHQVARGCKKLRHVRTHRQGEGPPAQQGLGCWASQRATRSSSRPSFGPQVRSTEVWLNGFFWCRISKVLLLFCANTRATYSLRGVPPAETEQFGAAHDVATWQSFTRLLRISARPEEAHDWARLPFQMGGCGLRSATRTRVPAHWARWADSLRMIHARHPGVAETMVRCLSGPTDMRHFSAAASCCADLRAWGWYTPEWEDFPTALLRALAALVPGVLAIPDDGWHDASLVLEQHFASLLPSGPCSARKVVLFLPPFHHSAPHPAPQVRVSPVPGPRFLQAILCNTAHGNNLQRENPHIERNLLFQKMRKAPACPLRQSLSVLPVVVGTWRSHSDEVPPFIHAVTRIASQIPKIRRPWCHH